MSDRTEKASQLQRDAADARNNKNWPKAEQSLRDAIPLLKAELEALESTFPSGSESTKAVAAQLADCLGSRGGILRRMGRDADALDSYRQGKDLEVNEDYQIESTYNRVQWIVLRILSNPAVLDDPAEEKATTDLASLRRRQAVDPWAWADVLLLAVLSDNNSLASEAFNAIDRPSTIGDVYDSGLRVFEQLASVMPDREVLQWAIRKYRVKLAALRNENRVNESTG
jgi:hypothetical protein